MTKPTEQQRGPHETLSRDEVLQQMREILEGKAIKQGTVAQGTLNDGRTWKIDCRGNNGPEGKGPFHLSTYMITLEVPANDNMFEQSIHVHRRRYKAGHEAAQASMRSCKDEKTVQEIEAIMLEAAEEALTEPAPAKWSINIGSWGIVLPTSTYARDGSLLYTDREFDVSRTLNEIKASLAPSAENDRLPVDGTPTQRGARKELETALS